MSHRNNPRYESATQEIADLVLRYHPDPGMQISIFTWTDEEDVYGLRVAEVSFTSAAGGTVSGTSFMQSDVYAAPVVFQVERAILEVFSASRAGAVLDKNSELELHVAKWRALHAIFGEDVANKFAADVRAATRPSGS